MTHKHLSCLGVKLIETNGFDSWKKREQKVTFPFQIRASAFFAARFSDLKNYRIAPFPISPTTVGPDRCWRLQQLPQGCQSSLGYNSLSTMSCNSAKAITTFPSVIPPKVLSGKLSSGSSVCLLVTDKNKFSIITAMRFLRRVYVYSPSASDPARSAHPKHISHTNTHLSHCSGPLHHRRIGLALLQRPSPTRRGQTNPAISLQSAVPP